MRFSLAFPAKPFRLTQAWGIYNPAYEQFGFTRHNGVDVALGADKKLYAPCDGTIVRMGNQPTGGGIYLGLMTEKWDWPEGPFRVLLDFLHCERLLVTEGQQVKLGDVLAVADNTGFSTGQHTHIQPRRVSYWNGQVGELLAWTPLDHNDANNSFDPLPFFNGRYAQDWATLAYLKQLLLDALQKLSLLKGRS